MCLSIKVHNPELVLAEGTHHGFEWTVTNNGMGFRCGYIRVPKGHPWHGQHYDNVKADCHGGLTFADPDEPCAKGGPDDAWWLGFDCAHLNDAPDPALTDERTDMPRRKWPGGTIRTQEYVEQQCRSLCEQAGQAGGAP